MGIGINPCFLPLEHDVLKEKGVIFIIQTRTSFAREKPKLPKLLSKIHCSTHFFSNQFVLVLSKHVYYYLRIKGVTFSL